MSIRRPASAALAGVGMAASLTLVVGIGVLPAEASAFSTTADPGSPAPTAAASTGQAEDGLETVPLIVEGAAATAVPAAEDLVLPDDETPLAAQRAPGDEALLQRTVPTAGAVVVGLAWRPAGLGSPRAEIRFRTATGWDEWADVEMTRGEGEDEARSGAGALAPVMSEGMVASGADAIEVRISGLDSAPVTDAHLVLVDGGQEATWPGPGWSAASSTGTTATAVGGVLTATGAPAVISRLRWGASDVPPRPECATPDYGTQLDRFVVHHTAGTNAYSAADSPAILRGIQRYHVDARGWCDIGYNVLVDKFGQVFEGRRGGLEELVVGVHASGHNTNTVGVSVLGDYTKVAPTTAAIDALVRVIAWKSYLHGIDPAGSAVKNGVLMPRVIGHRDVAQTSCPGAIQNHLRDIASRARSQMLTYQPEFTRIVANDGVQRVAPAVVEVDIPVPAGWTATLLDSSGTAVARRSGTVTRRATVTTEFATSHEAVLAAGSYSVRFDGVSTNGKVFSSTTPVRLRYPDGFVAQTPRVVLDVQSGSAGLGTLLTTQALGTPTTAAAVLLRVCASGPTTARISPSDLSPAMAFELHVGSGSTGCALGFVGTGLDRQVRVERPAGASGFRVESLGHLPAAGATTPYWDVAASPFRTDIGWVAGQRIATGNVDGSFRPVAPVSRQAIAAFLYRAAGSPAFSAPASPTFVDVSQTHPFFREIEWLAAAGIADGTDLGGGRQEFRPAAAVSRQAMAAFLYRAYDGSPTEEPSGFSDVTGTPFEAEIRWLAATRITTGNPDGTFRPTAPVSRHAMAAFLRRANEV
ncbi:S-layer homology domain-containing protein [Actinotalea ferrariae]|nr:S-layer homology domain-containing protein [Actinotalea ferrariae]